VTVIWYVIGRNMGLPSPFIYAMQFGLATLVVSWFGSSLLLLSFVSRLLV
jgi:hypothetical protein